MSDTSSETVIMSEETSSLVIEALEIQVQDLNKENDELRLKVGALEARLSALRLMLNSNMLDRIFPFL